MLDRVTEFETAIRKVWRLLGGEGQDPNTVLALLPAGGVGCERFAEIADGREFQPTSLYRLVPVSRRLARSAPTHQRLSDRSELERSSLRSAVTTVHVIMPNAVDSPSPLGGFSIIGHSRRGRCLHSAM
jgi:hypothetical protein